MSKRSEYQEDKVDYLGQWNARLTSAPQKPLKAALQGKLEALKTEEQPEAEPAPPSEAKPTV